MGNYVASDNAATTLASGISNSASVTSIVLTDASKFPVVNTGGTGSDWSYVTLYDSANNIETMKVTRRDNGSNTLTVVRGTAAGITGTTDASCRTWSASTTGVACRIVAQTVNDLYANSTSASASASAAASSASAAATSASNAETYNTQFKLIYQGSSSSDPTQRFNATSLQAGDLYFKSGPNAMYIYTGSTWVPNNTIADGGVTNAKLADGAVSRVNLSSDQQLPDHTGNSGKVLLSDGSAAYWGTANYVALSGTSTVSGALIVNAGTAGTGVSGTSTNSYGGYFQTSAGTYGSYSKSTHASGGGAIGYTANGTYYGIIGYGNSYSFYGNGTLYNQGSATVTGNLGVSGSITSGGASVVTAGYAGYQWAQIYSGNTGTLSQGVLTFLYNNWGAGTYQVQFYDPSGTLNGGSAAYWYGTYVLGPYGAMPTQGSGPYTRASPSIQSGIQDSESHQLQALTVYKARNY